MLVKVYGEDEGGYHAAWEQKSEEGKVGGANHDAYMRENEVEKLVTYGSKQGAHVEFVKVQKKKKIQYQNAYLQKWNGYCLMLRLRLPSS